MSLVDPVKKEAARRVDPTPLLARHGLTVSRPNGGRHLYARDGKSEVFRVTQKDDGHYVACDKYRASIGDNIALYRLLEPGANFQSAVAGLLGLPQGLVTAAASNRPYIGNCRRPKMPPPSLVAQAAGRSYLRSRGIIDGVISAAEAQGFMSYVNDGVLTIGRDDHGTARWISKRFLAGLCGPEGETKRDFAGSEKRFAAVLRGKSRCVYVVEGGTDALAAHSRAIRRGELTPSVIVTGGSGCLAWIEERHLQELMREAEEIILVYENELDNSGEIDQRTQKQTDQDHDKQLVRIETRIGKKVLRWRPPEGVKDIAALNVREIGFGGEIA